MNMNEYMDNVKGVKCLVIGDIILDEYISGIVNRISPEAPIPVMHIDRKWHILGGAANVACNIAGCGIETVLCGVLGEDFNAEKVIKGLKEKEIEFCGLKLKERITTTKTRIVGPNQQIVRLDEEITDVISLSEEEILFRDIMKCLSKVKVLVISDYNKGVCTETFCRRIIQEANKRGIFVIVDPKTKDWSKYSHADLITPNFKEYCEAVGMELSNNEQEICQSGKHIFSKFYLGGILVTRSQYGMTYLYSDLHCFSCTTKAREVYDVSGAGDTVIAVIAAFLSAGYPLEKAIEVSNFAAAISVGKKGTYVVSINEISDVIEERAMNLHRKIVSWAEIENTVKQWKEMGDKIVFTNGCFDILHRGHVEYLNLARKQGDHLIVGLNTDRSIKALKGDMRPVNNQEDRALLLSSLSFVDKVVLFDEVTPYDLIKMIKPDKLIKGGDYKECNVVGREFANEVIIVPIVEGYSTTNIILKKTNI
ncbi:PfkB family carbohydrate kinase [Lacrimispora aerotolerans]|uniref:PfkB family carbohydrate kinase n=1 Tax=Lacrimispora aerotolerans TaxID=36832 RepID=UPI000B282752|nr:bifunctional heptose 7-phosphate kinase/heptose 1-phosphate adenyltransferase [Lacrimispora aerotolerans]